jgi:hypothetical protein
LTGLKTATNIGHDPGIYVSSSIKDASYSRYSQIREIDAEYQNVFFQSGKYIQFVLECRVYPKSIEKKGMETLLIGTTNIDLLTLFGGLPEDSMQKILLLHILCLLGVEVAEFHFGV